MLRFEFWLCDGQSLPRSVPRLETDFREAKHDAKMLLAEHPELRKIDLICGQQHVGAVGSSWASCSCGDLTACGENCPKYLNSKNRSAS